MNWGAWERVEGQMVLATGGADGRVLLWDAETGGLYRPSGGAAPAAPARHSGSVTWGAWGRFDGTPVLATGGRDGAVWLWTAGGPEPREPVLDGGSASVWGGWVPYDSHRSALGVIDSAANLHFGILEGPKEPTGSLGPSSTAPSLRLLRRGVGAYRWGAWGLHPMQQTLITGSRDGDTRQWLPAGGSDPTSGPLERAEPVPPESEVCWGAWGEVGGRPVLATGGPAGTVWTGGPFGQNLIRPMTGHEGGVRWGAWGQVGDRPLLATGDQSEAVRLWDMERGTLFIEPLTGHEGGAAWGTWAWIGGMSVLAVGAGDGSVHLWDPERGEMLGEPLAGRGGAGWGAWAEVEGHPVLATGGATGAVHLWEVIEVRPAPRVPAYGSDTTGTTDDLARKGDARAVAELITAPNATPPLAVGLFGDWGEGKSHFLDLLHKQVEDTVQASNLWERHAVRQVRFNAWHYAETDLWASVVCEIFTQLAAPAQNDSGTEQRRQSRLTAETVAKRGLRTRLRAARERQAQLEQALVRPDELWRALPAEQRADLEDLGRGAEGVYKDVAFSLLTLRDKVRAMGHLIRRHPGLTALALTLFTALLCLATVVAPGATAWVAGLPAYVLVVLAAWRWLWARGQQARTAARQFAEEQRSRLENAVDVAAAEVAELECQVHNLTAAGQLAGLVAERAADQDYRGRLGMMTRIRQDFHTMASLLNPAAHPAAGTPTSRHTDEAGDELPRIDRIILYIDDLDRCPPQRVVEMLEAIHLLLAVELFVVVVAVDPRWLLRAVAAHYRDLLEDGPADMSGNAAPEDPDETVGEVDPDDEELWGSTPAQYLEKIFQVVLTLPPLDPDGYREMLRKLVGTEEQASETRTDPAGPRSRRADTPTADSPVQAGRLWDPALGERLPGPEDTAGYPSSPVLPPACPVERVDPLTLDPDELKLLDLLGPPMLVSTPRAVKRLANSYGLLSALRREHRPADLTPVTVAAADPGATTATAGGPGPAVEAPPRPAEPTRREVTYRPYRAGMVLLAALVAYPALGPALFLHLHHRAAAEPEGTWAAFRASLTPCRERGRWRNPADPHMTPVRAQQWRALLEGLDSVALRAAEGGLHLPDRLGAWGDWVVPVGRLSFPTGRIVSSLDRQRPL